MPIGLLTEKSTVYGEEDETTSRVRTDTTTPEIYSVVLFYQPVLY